MYILYIFNNKIINSIYRKHLVQLSGLIHLYIYIYIYICVCIYLYHIW